MGHSSPFAHRPLGGRAGRTTVCFHTICSTVPWTLQRCSLNLFVRIGSSDAAGSEKLVSIGSAQKRCGLSCRPLLFVLCKFREGRHVPFTRSARADSSVIVSTRCVFAISVHKLPRLASNIGNDFVAIIRFKSSQHFFPKY